ncbi:hypothetical protein Calab_3339 [Caldithrix abyssi DSM 13497]|uniref:SatD family (SatD) n=2 Tax=Caldithrix abyssi DSM 13497 TaxID=880073 RepID=H1XVP3_CALAY|nr:hypothetical protein Calab_3339 [Caldithrix abyssi DSM 13497]
MQIFIYPLTTLLFFLYLTGNKCNAYINIIIKEKLMKNHFVFIGDIIQSRRITDRAQVQRKFSQAIEKLAKSHGHLFLSPPTLTIGDEFQAVVKSTANLFLILHQFEVEMHPVHMRFGFGLGSIDTPLNTRAAIGMDGSAFHNARTAIEEARQLGKKYALVSSINKDQSAALKLLLSWIDLNLQNWSNEKLQIFVWNRQGKRQREIADILNISQPAVSQHINKPIFALLLESEQYLEKQFNIFLQGNKND